MLMLTVTVLALKPVPPFPAHRELAQSFPAQRQLVHFFERIFSSETGVEAARDEPRTGRDREPAGLTRRDENLVHELRRGKAVHERVLASARADDENAEAALAHCGNEESWTTFALEAWSPNWALDQFRHSEQAWVG